MPEVSRERWHEYIQRHPQSHFLQMGEWGDLKSQYGWHPVRLVVGTNGAQVLFRKLPFGLTLAYIPKLHPDQVRGEEAVAFWAELDSICRLRGAIACKLELDAWEGRDEVRTPEGFMASAHGVQPRRTIMVDLRPSEAAILEGMKQKCRYNVRLAQKKDVSVRPWNNIPVFHAMLRVTARRDGFGVHALEYYQQAYALFHPMGACDILMAESEGQPLAALMVFARGSRAWYVYGGSSDAHREKMPNYLLQWEAMRWAKARGCSEYDLWGVPDEDEAALEAEFAERSDGLWGVYRFKRGFGGELRRAQPAMDRIYSPPLYRLYLLAAAQRQAA